MTQTTPTEQDTPMTYSELLRSLRDDGISIPRIAARARKLADGLSEDGYVDDEKVEKLAEATSAFIDEVEGWMRSWGEPVDMLTLVRGLRADCERLEVDLTDLEDLRELLASEEERISDDLNTWHEAAVDGYEGDDEEGEEDTCWPEDDEEPIAEGDAWLYDAPRSAVLIPITSAPVADLTEFDTRESALAYLDGAWLDSYGPQELASDLELQIVAANFRASENVQLNW